MEKKNRGNKIMQIFTNNKIMQIFTNIEKYLTKLIL